MKNQNVVVVTILLFGVLNMKLQCNKYDGVTPENKYEFKENVTLTPYKLDNAAGDTIWLTVNIPDKKLFDEKTNSKIFFDSVSFTTTAQVDLLYNNPFISTGPFASFVFPAAVSGYVYSGIGQTAATVTYGCSPSTDYSLVLGIILKEKGVFGISF